MDRCSIGAAAAMSLNFRCDALVVVHERANGRKTDASPHPLIAIPGGRRDDLALQIPPVLAYLSCDGVSRARQRRVVSDGWRDQCEASDENDCRSHHASVWHARLMRD